MCLPAIVPAITAAASAIGPMQWLSMGASAIGGIMQARGQQQQGQDQSDILNRQADQKDAEARDATKRGQENVRRQLLKAGQIRGTQTAALAASGVEVDSGSPLAILLDTQTIAELDAQTIARNAEREAAGISSSAADTRRQSDLALKKGKSEATSSLLTTGMTVADKWYKYS